MLKTVHYEDEPPVSYVSELDRQILEYLKYATGTTIREVYAVAREIILEGFDPVDATGDEFDFPCGSRPDCWISPQVPGAIRQGGFT
jgi:hypothetical protein